MVGAFFFFLGRFGHDAIGGEQQTRHRSGILQGRTVDFCGGEYAILKKIAVLQCQSVEAKRTLAFGNLGHNHGAFFTRVLRQGSQRNHQGLTKQIHTKLFIT